MDLVLVIMILSGGGDYGCETVAKSSDRTWAKLNCGHQFQRGILVSLADNLQVDILHISISNHADLP